MHELERDSARPHVWRRAGRRVLAAVAALGAGLTLAAACGAPLAAQARGGDDDQQERPEVTKVEFRGVRALGRGEIAEGLATQESGCNSLVLRVFCTFSKSPAFYTRRYLDRTELSRDVIRVLVTYYRRGWRDAAVDTTVTRSGPNQVRVTFTVREGEPTRVRAIAVDDSLLPSVGPQRRRIQRLVGLAPGDPLDLTRLDTAVVRLREAYWERGYGNAVVERAALAVDSAADTAVVRIPVRRGTLTPIAALDIVRLGGAQRVTDETIRNSLTIAPGDLFKRSEIGRSQRALYESGLFRRAVIDTAVVRDPTTGQTVCAVQALGTPFPATRAAAGAPDTTKSLAVCVEEGPFRDVRVSAGFTTADFGQIEGRYSHNYWLGGARRLDLSGVVANLGAEQLFRVQPFASANGFNTGRALQDQLARAGRFFVPTYQLGANVQQRWFGSPRNTVGAGVFAHRRSSPAVFVDRGIGGNLSFTREVIRSTPVSATYRFERNRVEAGDIYFCVNYGVCDGPTVLALGAPQRLSPLALTANVNRTNDPFTPSRGVLGRALVEYGGRATLSDFAWARGLVEASTYRRLRFRRTVLAVRGRVGYVTAFAGTNRALGLTGEDGEILHPRTRFYAGGAQSVRGFGENQLGPKVLTIDPNRLRGVGENDNTPAAPACAGVDSTALRNCFNARVGNGLGDGDFVSRPLGGTSLIEGNVELRIPITGPIVGALFLDGAMLGEGGLTSASRGTRVVTPGFGVRYRSPVGPVRVDIGYRPTLRERLPVITEFTDETGQRRLFDLTSNRGCDEGNTSSDGCRIFPQDKPTGIGAITRRITLHLSIGEAF